MENNNKKIYIYLLITKFNLQMRGCKDKVLWHSENFPFGVEVLTLDVGPLRDTCLLMGRQENWWLGGHCGSHFSETWGEAEVWKTSHVPCNFNLGFLQMGLHINMKKFKICLLIQRDSM